jgi:hypothetical protein
MKDSEEDEGMDLDSNDSKLLNSFESEDLI